AEDVDDQDKGRDDNEGEKTDESDADDDDRDEDDDEEEIAKPDEQEDTESGDGDAEETKNSEDDGNGEEDQGLRVSKEQRLIEEEEADELYHDVDINQGRGLQVSQDIEEEEADELYHDVDINQGRGLQVSQDIEDSHVILTPVQPDGVESIFTTASSSIAPIQTSTPIMTPSTIAIITTSSEAPIPPTTIPSAVLKNLPTFDLVFRFEDRVKSLEVNFSEFMQTDQFAEAVSKSPGIVHQYMTQQMTEAEGPSARSDRGSKRRREGGEPASASSPSEPATISASRSTIGTQSRQMSASESAFAEEPVQTTCQMDEPPHPVFETGAEDQPIVQTSQHPECELAKQADSRSSFNELLDTPIDFSNFIMNRLCVDTLTPELLAGPTYELMRGSCNSLTELEYHLEEVYKATTDQLDWVNPEGQQYPHNLLQPLLLIPDNRGHRIIPFAHFINNDLEYLQGGASSRKYTTSMTKTKAADYGHIKWIEDLVPRTMWIQEPLNYDKHTLWRVSHWGQKRQQFYGFAVNQESALDVYSKRRITAVTDLKIVEWHNYKHLDWISVRRNDDKIYKFKEVDFKRLRLQDIEDILLHLVQGKLSNLIVEERFAFNVSLRMFTRNTDDYEKLGTVYWRMTV
nr:hypothetical protein [Tanacetum cinerariifolium]